MKKIILTAVLVITAFNSFAWGDREQGALLGIIAGAVISNEMNKQPTQRPQPQQRPQEIIIYERPTVRQHNEYNRQYRDSVDVYETETKIITKKHYRVCNEYECN